MKLLNLILAFGLAACATSEPHHGSLERGTLTRPPPAPHRPGVGLPMPGQPHVRVEPPPQPKPKRLLPQTPNTRRVPGIWASRAPDTAPTVEIFRERIPAPEDPKERSLVLWCREHAFREFGPEAFKSKSPEWRKCAGATVISACLEAEAKRLERKVDANAARHYEPKRIEVAQAARARMEAIGALFCDGHSDQDTNNAGAAMSRRISNILWGAP